MDPGTSKERFENLMASSGITLASLTPRAGLELMLRFYGDDPANGRLTCWWGVVTRYGDEEFGFHISREFDPPDECLLPTNLTLSFKIGLRTVAGDFPGWSESEKCNTPEQLAAFSSAIERSGPFKQWGRSPSAGVALVYGDLLSWFQPLIDRWGVRDPSRPVVSMTEEEWLRSDDVPLMLRWIRQEWRGQKADLDRLLQGYFLACCRRIWRLLPVVESRAAVGVAERFADGLASLEEYRRAEWLAEVASFRFDQDPERAAAWSDEENRDAARWCEEVSRISSDEFNALIPLPRPEDALSVRTLLMHAADFAHSAACYDGLEPKESIEKYKVFLPAPLLREVVGNPFRFASSRPPT